MLQIDHVYEFLYQELFKDFENFHLINGVPIVKDTITPSDISIFTPEPYPTQKIFFYDQEPFVLDLSMPYMTALEKYWISSEKILVTSEISPVVDEFTVNNGYRKLYYFYHGFAALDWYRGHYSLNFTRPVIRDYQKDFISFNRIITQDRSYRIYWCSRLAELGLLNYGLVSFNVTDNLFDDWRDEVADPDTKLSEQARQHAERHLTDINKLVIDHAELPGSASADIPRNIHSNMLKSLNQHQNVDALWHVVTETVFYYNKLHLTEKIFKPIVSKQPFMLIAAPGNLAYLRSYGFKTFDGIIDESYDSIQDNDQRIEAVAAQLNWYCSLSQEEKNRVIERLAPIVEHNFQHFYGAFRHIITKELLTNCQILFKEIGYDDKTIAYNDIYRVLTN